MTTSHFPTTSPLRSPGPGARVALAAYGLLAAANLTGIVTGHDGLANAAQWLLMPSLALAFLTLAPRGAHPLPRLRTAALAALFFSWLGDTLPDLVPEGVAFLAMVGCFLLAQVAYIVGFLPFRRESLTSRPLALLPYAVALVGLLLATAPRAGALAGPVLVYGVTLTAMAVLATGVNSMTGIGAAVFMLSDSLIALGAFRGWDSTAQPFGVMATYALAQLLIVLGVQSRRAAETTGARD